MFVVVVVVVFLLLFDFVKHIKAMLKVVAHFIEIIIKFAFMIKMIKDEHEQIYSSCLHIAPMQF